MFAIGDAIVLDDITGVVVDVGLEDYTVRWSTGHVMSYVHDVDWEDE